MRVDILAALIGMRVVVVVLDEEVVLSVFDASLGVDLSS